MKYVCLVYGEEQKLDDLSVDGLADLDRRSTAYDKVLADQGSLIMAEALRSVKTAKSLRRRARKNVITDGPFAETKEQLLGFIMIDAPDLDAALKIAADIPLAELGTIEVRAIYDVPSASDAS